MDGSFQSQATGQPSMTSTPTPPEPRSPGSIPPPITAPTPANLTEVGVLLGRLNQQIAHVSRKLDRKPSRLEQVVAFVLAVALAGVGAYFTAYFTTRDIGRNIRTTELAKKEVETYVNTIFLLGEVERGFEAFIISKGKEDKKADARAAELQKLIESQAAGEATSALDKFNDYVQHRKAELQSHRELWRNNETEAMQHEAKNLYEVAFKVLSDWFKAKR